MEKFNLTYTGAQVQALLDKVSNLVDLIYPVGSVYMSMSNTLPTWLSENGTWKNLENTSTSPSTRYLLSSASAPVDTGDAHTVNSTTVTMANPGGAVVNDGTRPLVVFYNSNEGKSYMGYSREPSDYGTYLWGTPKFSNLWANNSTTTVYCWRRVA